MTLKYSVSGTPTTHDLTAVLMVKGVDAWDKYELYPGTQAECLDGELVEEIIGTRRDVLLVGHAPDDTDVQAIHNFIKDPNRAIEYLDSGDLYFALQDPSSFEIEWYDDCELIKMFTIELRERTITVDSEPS